MSAYEHHSANFFVHREKAGIAMGDRISRRLQQDCQTVYASVSTPAPPLARRPSNATLDELRFDGAIGTGVGAEVLPTPWHHYE